MRVSRILLFASLVAGVVLAACGGEGGQPADTATTTTGAQPAGGMAPNVPQTPDPGGQVITVQMVTDEKGNFFEPANFTAKKGDVIRYTLKAGVHNVHFLADSNSGKSGFPTAPSEMLQLPGQTFDVKVTWAPGKYYYQCDPHAMLGMIGYVTVQ